MYKVLIADDEVKVCRLIQNVIDWEKLGLVVVGVANDGINALEMIREKTPDIVITDIRMPGYDGLQLIEKAKQFNSEIRFVIISGHREFAYAQSAIRFGVEDYLLKPLEETELEEILTRMVKKKDEDEEDNHQEIKLKKRVKVDTKRIQKTFLEKLLTMDKNDEINSLEWVNQEYYCDFQEGLFQVVVVKIDILERNVGEDGYSLLMNRAEKIAQSILEPDSFQVIGLKREEGIYFLINMDETYEKDIRKRFKKIRLEICAQRDLFWDMKATIGMGNVKEDFSFIKESADEARKVILNRLFIGLGHTIGMGNQEIQVVPLKDIMDFKLKTEILERIEVLDIKAIYKCLDQIEQSVNQNAGTDGLLLLEICGTLMDILRYGLKKINYETLGNSLTKEFSRQFYQMTKVADVFETLRLVFEQAITEITKSKEEMALRPVRTAKQYIQDHYDEPLKLEDISQMIGFNTNYFSGMFKKETGESFSQYLIQVRLSKAKQILIMEEINVADVAERVGYSDVKHFSKLFKKMSGLNPTEFRKLYRKLD